MLYKLITITFLFYSVFLGAQNNCQFGKTFTVGSSFTYIPIGEATQDIKSHEFTLNINTAISITERLDLGISAFSIFASSDYKEYENYSIFGFFAQYDLFVRTNQFIFLEASLNRGNYCSTRSEFYPFRRDNLYYYGLGGGYNIQLKKWSKHLFLDLAFVAYNIFNKIEGKIGYNIYIIGLNYKFGKMD